MLPITLRLVASNFFERELKNIKCHFSMRNPFKGTLYMASAVAPELVLIFVNGYTT